MTGHSSRTGCRADGVRVSDWPHTRYYDDGIPLLSSSSSGSIIEKSVETYTLVCPKCEQAGTYDENDQPICEECGRILSGGTGVPSTPHGDPLVMDAKAAGRVPADPTP